MKIIYNPVFLEHDTGMHPENRKRLESLLPLEETIIENGEKYLELFHTKAYISEVKNASREGAYLDPDTIASKGSYNAAVHAVGATVMASKTLDFATVRPPGHHAHPNHSSGFCIFNNIAVATQKLLNKGKRVLIFDFDGHLGDGTEKFFYDKENVMYWSIHQYPAFPGGGTEDQTGEGPAKGNIINVPMPAGAADDVYIDSIERILPVAKQFNPDVVAVSAGFDAHQHDLLLELKASMNLYHRIGKTLSENFKKVFATLEGGYNTEIFPKCVHNFVDGVNGKPAQHKEKHTETEIKTRDEYEGRMARLEKNLKEYWKI